MHNTLNSVVNKYVGGFSKLAFDFVLKLIYKTLKYQVFKYKYKQQKQN